jgi:hypothetical protein
MQMAAAQRAQPLDRSEFTSLNFGSFPQSPLSDSGNGPSSTPMIPSHRRREKVNRTSRKRLLTFAALPSKWCGILTGVTQLHIRTTPGPVPCKGTVQIIAHR